MWWVCGALTESVNIGGDETWAMELHIRRRCGDQISRHRPFSHAGAASLPKALNPKPLVAYRLCFASLRPTPHTLHPKP